MARSPTKGLAMISKRPIPKVPIALLCVLAMLTAACDGISIETGSGSTDDSAPVSTATTEPVQENGSSQDGNVGVESDGAQDNDGGAAEQATTTTAPAPAVLDPQVTAALGSYGAWQTDVQTFTDDRALSDKTWEEPGRVQVMCSPGVARTFAPGPIDEFATFPFSGDLVPGLLVQGDLVKIGDLQPLPLRRSPQPLRIDLPLTDQTEMVADPTSSSLAASVSTLMRRADDEFGTARQLPAEIRFYQQEVSSYEEAMLSVGVSLRYKSKDLRGEFSSAFEQNSSQQKHTVVVRFTQPMYTVSADSSTFANAGSYLHPETSLDELRQLEGQGRIGPSNPPVLIDSVTYGRLVYMTITSTQVESASELAVAVSGAYGGFSGEGDVQTKNREIIQSSEVAVWVAGGGDQTALAGLRSGAKSAFTSGTIAQFMESVDASTARPLTMTLRTLDRTKLSVTDEAQVVDVSCTRDVRPASIDMRLSIGDNTWVELWVNDRKITTYKTNGPHTVDMLPYLDGNVANRVELVYKPPTCIAGSMDVSFLVENSLNDGGQWRIAGRWDEWACTETGSWTINPSSGLVSYASGPPALRPVG